MAQTILVIDDSASLRQVVALDELALKHLEPRRAFHVLAAVPVPGDVELGLRSTGAATEMLGAKALN